MSHEIAAALIIRSGRVLLGQRSARRAFYPNVWDVFGGHMEPGEKRHETLFRELQEELGITPTEWMYVETLYEPADQLTVHLYLVTAWQGEPVNRQLDEHSTIGWFSLTQATQLPLADPSYPRLFAKYLDPDSLLGKRP
jgi:8-oxo-dGTP diphosphatase